MAAGIKVAAMKAAVTKERSQLGSLFSPCHFRLSSLFSAHPSLLSLVITYYHSSPHRK
ncbi:hypothetical protein [Prevotella multiformis]|uniref:hypothetical protein n=1 Tax=Prevotella multiformis TaxID=282402 RepID=UPI003F9ED41B